MVLKLESKALALGRAHIDLNIDFIYGLSK
jgi:hypothetical protein